MSSGLRAGLRTLICNRRMTSGHGKPENRVRRCEAPGQDLVALVRPSSYTPPLIPAGIPPAARNSLIVGEAPMAVPKRKTSPSKRGMRRGHDAISTTAYIEDKDTGELRRPHHVDLKTGMYRGKQILTPKED